MNELSPLRRARVPGRSSMEMAGRCWPYCVALKQRSSFAASRCLRRGPEGTAPPGGLGSGEAGAVPGPRHREVNVARPLNPGIQKWFRKRNPAATPRISRPARSAVPSAPSAAAPTGPARPPAPHAGWTRPIDGSGANSGAPEDLHSNAPQGYAIPCQSFSRGEELAVRFSCFQTLGQIELHPVRLTPA